jgi:hypothetical protein
VQIAVKYIGSRRAFRIKEVRKEIKRTLVRRVKPKAKEYPKKVVANWSSDHRPDFQGTYFESRNEMGMYVYPWKNKWFWIWVSLGTEGDYEIVAVNVPYLIYREGYVPKTKPGGLYGGPGVEFGNIVRRRGVIHPGIEARLFELDWAGEADSWFPPMMHEALLRGLERARK